MSCAQSVLIELLVRSGRLVSSHGLEREHDHALHANFCRPRLFDDCFCSCLRTGRRRCLKDHLRSIFAFENYDPQLIAAWFSGYYNAKRNNKIIDLETLEDNVSR
jgi:hypothetical protein